MAAGWWSEFFPIANAILAPLEASIDAVVTDIGTLEVVLDMPVAALAGAIQPSGIIAVTNPGLIASISAVQKDTGSFTAGLPMLSAAIDAGLAPGPAAIFGGIMPQVTAAMIGAQAQSGTVSGILSAITTLMSATQSDPAMIHVVLQQAGAAMSGSQKDAATVTAMLQQLLVAIAASQALPMAYDSGAGAEANYAASDSWTHTTVSTHTTIYAFLAGSQSSITGATCDGVAMTSAGSTSQAQGNLMCLKAAVTTAGAHSISGAAAGSGGISGFSVAVTGVTTTGTAQTGGNASTAASMAVTLGTGKFIIQAFGALNGGASAASFTGPSGGTNRYNATDGNRTGLSVSTATATTTFTATGTPSYYSGWLGLALILS